MDYSFLDRQSQIVFSIPVDATDILEQIAFVVLVEFKFDAERSEPILVLRGDNPCPIGTSLIWH